MRERREKLFRLGPESLMQWFNAGRRDSIRIPRMTNVPDDAAVQRISVDSVGLCWHVVVAHDSFDVVPDGQWPPDGGPLFVEMVELRRKSADENEPDHFVVDLPHNWRGETV